MSGSGGGNGDKPRPLPNLAGGSKPAKKKPAQSTIIGNLPPRPPAPPAGGGSKELDQGAASAWGASPPPTAPTPPPAAAPAPTPAPPPPMQPAPLPPMQPAPPPAAPPQSSAANPFGAQAPAAPPAGDPFGATPPPQAPGLGAAAGAGAGSFFDGAAPQQQQAPAAPQQKIALDAALAAVGVSADSSANPIIAAAADLLILFGRLRTGIVEMSAQPLLQHVRQEIEAFDGKLRNAGGDPAIGQVAKYVLCGTADDVVQNIPGADRDLWLQYSMAAQFFNVRNTGQGIFHEIDKALQSPAQQADLLELMLVCLSLGFEGQFRGTANGQVELQRYRAAIYNALLSVRPKNDDDISSIWAPVVLKGKNFGATPVWAVASVVGLLLFGVFLGLRVFLANDGAAAAAVMAAAHPESEIRIERPDPVPEYIPPPPPKTNQLERIQGALASDISAGHIKIEQTPTFIVLRMNNVVLFASGKADTKPEFVPLAKNIGAMLNNEAGSVTVIGHTDNIPMSGRGQYKDNFELSVARAQGVGGVLGQYLSNPDRLQFIGQGADSPIATNKTREGRALNRRVDVLVKREEAL